jgi:phospholipid:diacylglycerol acyltransferase
MQKEKRRFITQRRFLFPFGIFRTSQRWYKDVSSSQNSLPVGIMLGFILLQRSDIEELHAQLSLLLSSYELSLPHLSLLVPDLDFSRLEAEWARIQGAVFPELAIPELWKINNDGREFQVGEAMRDRGLTAVHPVVIIPGIISTNLESWSTHPDFRAFFRTRIWGGLGMLSQVMFNKEKWIAAMMLDPATGLDPHCGAKVRAAEGIDAASSFVQGYWIWCANDHCFVIRGRHVPVLNLSSIRSKIVENLAAVNYDTSNLHLAAYDWRVSYWNLEERDGYFSKLKGTIEAYKYVFKRPPVDSPFLLFRVGSDRTRRSS